MTIAARWAYLDFEARAELDNAGLWVDSSAMTPEETVEAILVSRDLALRGVS
jgi:hypothetical protein